MIKTYCDRCEKEIKDSVRYLWIADTYHFNLTDKNIFRQEICKECSDLIEKRPIWANHKK